MHLLVVGRGLRPPQYAVNYRAAGLPEGSAFRISFFFRPDIHWPLPALPRPESSGTLAGEGGFCGPAGGCAVHRALQGTSSVLQVAVDNLVNESALNALRLWKNQPLICLLALAAGAGPCCCRGLVSSTAAAPEEVVMSISEAPVNPFHRSIGNGSMEVRPKGRNASFHQFFRPEGVAPGTAAIARRARDRRRAGFNLSCRAKSNDGVVDVEKSTQFLEVDAIWCRLRRYRISA